MQVVRDAVVLLVVVLIMATVRVSPVPEIELSPAQAAQTRPAISVETPSGTAVPAQGPAQGPALLGPALDRDGGDGGGDREKPICPGSMASRSAAQQNPEDPAHAPCHV